MLRFIFPLPPSSNNLFAGRSRRYRSKEYKAWQQIAGLALSDQVSGCLKLPPPFAVTITVCGKINEQRDLANFEKATVDLLVAREIIHDDSLKFVHKITLEYRPDRGEGRVEVVVETMPGW